MNEIDDFVKVLQKVLGNENFIISLMGKNLEYDSDEIVKKLATVLMYYIATRDLNTNYTYEEIESKYNEIRKQNLAPGTILYRNIVERGFFTHSFNGYKKERIIQQGFDATGITEIATLDERRVAREMLEQLESILGRSRMLNDEKIGDKAYRHHIDEFFITAPGTLSIYYSYKVSPERLYEGPLKQKYGHEEPIVVGETKQTYMLRVLTRKIKEKYPDETSREYKDALQIAKSVTKYYCTQQPAIALIAIESIRNIDFSNGVYNEEDLKTLGERIKRAVDYPNQYMGDFFSIELPPFMSNKLCDLVTLSKNMPSDAVSGIIDVIDEFEIKQIFAKLRGRMIGDVIDYNTCAYVGEPTLEQLMELMDTVTTKEELEELKKKVEKIRQELSKSDDLTDVDQRKKKLESNKRAILEEKYAKKQGISTEYSLSLVLDEIHQKGLMGELLRQDAIIAEDELQYRSDVHGASHTRRVNFFATAIMNMENVSGRDRQIIFQIVKNHDIGRVNDHEDKVHGSNSVQKMEDDRRRLSGFDEEECQLIKFVIEQHSRTKKENEQALKRVPKSQKERYSRLLNILKDADKLDRVRLDRYGKYPEEGLDTSRLTLESSKRLENIAYESYDKLLDILDIERQMQKISRAEEMQIQFNEMSRRIREAELKKNPVEFWMERIRKIMNRDRRIDSDDVFAKENLESEINWMMSTKNNHRIPDNKIDSEEIEF